MLCQIPENGSLKVTFQLPKNIANKTVTVLS